MPPESRTTAKLVPSGDQSAHCTFSRTSRGAPPARGARARVPMVTHAPMALLFSKTAISDVEETDMSWVWLSPMERDSGASGRAVNTSVGLPCQADAVQNGLAIGGKAGGSGCCRGGR